MREIPTLASQQHLLKMGEVTDVDVAVLVDVSKRWRGIQLTPRDLEKLNALRSEVVPLAAAG